MMQCPQCRHSRNIKGQLRCLVRLQQMCSVKEGKQMLQMVPGLCEVLNPEDNCPDYSAKISIRLKRLFGKEEAKE